LYLQIKLLNNIVFVGKSYYSKCLINGLGISGNPTYKNSSFCKDDILVNYKSFMSSDYSFGIFKLFLL